MKETQISNNKMIEVYRVCIKWKKTKNKRNVCLQRKMFHCSDKNKERGRGRYCH